MDNFWIACHNGIVPFEMIFNHNFLNNLNEQSSIGVEKKKKKNINVLNK